MKIKKVVLFLSIVVLIFSISTCLAANVKVQINGNIIDFTDESGNKVEAQTINSRTMVPLRKIFEILGCEIEWDGATKTVTAHNTDKTIKLTIGNNNAYVKNNKSNNEKNVVLDSVPVIKDNRTLVPLRFISESLDNIVGWDKANATAIIINYDELANIITEKIPVVSKTKSDKITVEEKYYDDKDSSNNYETTYTYSSNNDDALKTIYSISITGNSDLVKEIENEEWNSFTYEENINGIITSNYVFSKMLDINKNELAEVNFAKIGLSRKEVADTKTWIKTVSELDEASINVDTYKQLLNDWNKFLNTFLSANKTLKESDFEYTYIDLAKIISTRIKGSAINPALIIGKLSMGLSTNYNDLLSDYPTITYKCTNNNDSITINVLLKNEYKERKEFNIIYSK